MRVACQLDCVKKNVKNSSVSGCHRYLQKTLCRYIFIGSLKILAQFLFAFKVLLKRNCLHLFRYMMQCRHFFVFRGCYSVCQHVFSYCVNYTPNVTEYFFLIDPTFCTRLQLEAKDILRIVVILACLSTPYSILFQTCCIISCITVLYVLFFDKSAKS